MSIHPLTLPRPSVDATAFREAMARLASGVAVVACWDGETPRGLLVSSLTALSTQPPRVLFCVGKTASSHAALLAAQDCSLNLLSDEDQGVAERFSRNDLTGERFADEAWRLERTRPPERVGALVSLRGLIDRKIDAGSHSIFIIRVEAADNRERAPLVYFDRAFHRLVPASRP